MNLEHQENKIMKILITGAAGFIGFRYQKPF